MRKSKLPSLEIYLLQESLIASQSFQAGAVGAVARGQENIKQGASVATGIGGAVGFGDPVRHLGFSYCCNRMAPIADLGPFAPPMIDAMYAAL